MKSVKCPECGFVGWADAERCKKCGVIRLPDPSGDAYDSGPAYSTYEASYYSGQKLKTGLAVTALVIGILDLFTLGLLGVGAILGITLSVVALSKAKRNPEEYGGQGMATAGLVLSILSVVLIVPMGLVAAIAIPNVLAARRAANEGATIASLRKFNSAQATYQATSGRGEYGSMEQLISVGLVSADFGKPSHYGYKFTVMVRPAEDPEQPAGFEVTAVPANYGSTGIRSFYVDETGVVRAANSRGAPATELDDPLDDSRYTSRPPPQLRNNYRDY